MDWARRESQQNLPKEVRFSNYCINNLPRIATGTQKRFVLYFQTGMVLEMLTAEGCFKKFHACFVELMVVALKL